MFMLLISSKMQAQITITASDMPVSGDTLRYTTVSPVGSTISLTDTGASRVWNYTSFTPLRQGVDTYKTATAVNILYALISFSAYGYRVADTLPGTAALPVSINDVYTFFEKKSSPNSFAAVAFAAKIAGVPTPINYSTDDTWYFFPLNYGNMDSSNYALNISLPSVGALKQAGYRKSKVDAWGTITTPYYTTPQNCIRVRSEIHEIDSVKFGTTATVGFPRNSVEYKWLVNGGHYPGMWVTTNVITGAETITSIRYRDVARTITLPTSVAAPSEFETDVKAFPVPAANGMATLSLPATWREFHIDVLDMNSRTVFSSNNDPIIHLENCPAGSYFARIISGTNIQYVKIVR